MVLSLQELYALQGEKGIYIISSANEVNAYQIARRAIYRIALSAIYRQKGQIRMTDPKNELREMSIAFALFVSDVCDEIKGCRSYVDQIVRSSSSIGANLYEAKYAQSRADFIHKLEISLKECSETEYWLELLHRKGKLTDEQYKALNNTRGTIQRKLIASITTAKKNSGAHGADHE